MNEQDKIKAFVDKVTEKIHEDRVLQRFTNRIDRILIKAFEEEAKKWEETNEVKES